MDKSKENTRVADLIKLSESSNINDLDLKIIMGIKNPAILNDFRAKRTLGLSMFSYAVAAGLIDWDDFKWIKEHINEGGQTDEDEDGGK